MQLVDLKTAVEWVEAEIEKRGADYRYTKEPLYKRKSQCVNVLFDYDPDFVIASAEDEYELDNPNSKVGKNNFRPGCVVGAAVTSNLVDQDWIFHMEANSAGVGELFKKLYSSGTAYLTFEAQQFLTAVQSRQDTGRSWGDAYSLSLQDALRDMSAQSEECDEEYLQSVFGPFRPREEWTEHLEGRLF